MGLEWKDKDGRLFADSEAGQYWITSGHFYGLFVFSAIRMKLERLGTFHDIESAKAKAEIALH